MLAILAVLDRSAPVWALGSSRCSSWVWWPSRTVGVIAWIGGDAPAEPVVFFSYLVACLAIPPLMVWWGRGEPGRWGSGVVAIACLVLAVLVLRVQQVWSGTEAGIGHEPERRDSASTLPLDPPRSRAAP